MIHQTQSLKELVKTAQGSPTLTDFSMSLDAKNVKKEKKKTRQEFCSWDKLLEMILQVRCVNSLVTVWQQNKALKMPLHHLIWSWVNSKGFATTKYSISNIYLKKIRSSISDDKAKCTSALLLNVLIRIYSCPDIIIAHSSVVKGQPVLTDTPGLPRPLPTNLNQSQTNAALWYHNLTNH